jgi:dihydrodipicolinate synthase/N-acetylneuraminate lyase
MKLHGIYVPNVMPLHADGRINETELRQHIRWLAEKGVTGIYANGSTGEFTRFTAEEHRRTIEIVAEESAGRLGIIAGAVEATPELTLDACEAYAKLGCDAVSLCPPVYFRPGQEALREHFIRLADRSPIPILLYNIPAFAVLLAPDTICELARHPQIIGLKDSTRDLAGFLTMMQDIRAFRPDFVFFTGTEEILLPALLMGAAGGTIATAGCLPEAILGLHQAWQRGDVDGARRLQLALLPVIKLMFSLDFPLGFRAAVELRGFDIGPCRQSLSAAQEKAVVGLKAELQPLMAQVLATLGATL